MLEVKNLVHSFNGVKALRGISFAMKQGEILGFLGPNGAGKTTTMRIIAGFFTPSSGEVYFEGKEIRKNPMEFRRQLGYLPENVPLYPDLTVREYLDWVVRIKGGDPRREMKMAVERCGLVGVKNSLISHLSRGYRQRVGMAQAILGDAKLLLLDEPTIGLDPSQIREIRSLIQELGADKTIILSTHILAEVELICNRVLIMNKGSIVAEDTPERLKRGNDSSGSFLLRLSIPQDKVEAVSDGLKSLSCINEVRMESECADGCVFLLSVRSGLDRRAEITRFVSSQEWPMLEFKAIGRTLEDIFVSLVQENS